MTIDTAAPGRLVRVGGTALAGKRRPITRPTQILAGTIGELVDYVDGQDRDDLWRYTIVTVADEQHIMGAELRALLAARHAR